MGYTSRCSRCPLPGSRDQRQMAQAMGDNAIHSNAGQSEPRRVSLIDFVVYQGGLSAQKNETQEQSGYQFVHRQGPAKLHWPFVACCNLDSKV